MEELEQSTEIKIEEQAALLPEVERPETATLVALPAQSLAIVALDRAIGMCIDFTSISMVALAPCLYRYFTRPVIENSFITIFSDPAMFGCFCLAISPLPLMYLRFVFRKLLRSPTPGEMFAGTIAISLVPGISGVFLELLYAMFQYSALALGAILGLLLISLCLDGGLFEAANSTVRVLAWASLPLFSICFASAANWPRSKSDHASTLDDLCGFEVQRLR